ncbi:MAG: ATP-binding protein [Litoreibacter sp.]|nr:ATP-binding protein [Litoreibacter sp.]
MNAKKDKTAYKFTPTNEPGTQGKIRGAYRRRQNDYAIWRLSMLSAVVLLLAITFDDFFGIIWVGGFILSDFLERRFSERYELNRDTGDYQKAQIAFLGGLIVFRSMVPYLWFHEHPSSDYLALVVMLVATRASGTPLHRTSSRIIMASTTDLAAILFLAIMFLFFAPQIQDAIFVGAALIGLTVYYVISTVQAIEKLRSIELLEEKNQQALKMEAIGRLTGGVAHDFNNILTVILGNIDLARETPLNPEAAELLDNTQVAAHRAAELTSQLLAFSRRSPLVLREHDLPALLRRSITLAERLLPPNIEIELDISSGLWTIKTDAGQLETALLNLMTNARDAMPSGGRITIKARNLLLMKQDTELSEGPCVELVFKDEGSGIPSAVIGQVTEPFFTTKPVGEGSGLGLSMVKGFVEQTGGKIDIQSVPGKSTTITLLLRATGQIGPSPSADTGL